MIRLYFRIISVKMMAFIISLELKMPKQMRLYRLYRSISDILESRSLKSSNISTEHRVWRDTNFNHQKANKSSKGFYRQFCKLGIFPRRKTGQIDLSGVK